VRSPIRKPGKFTHDKQDFHITEKRHTELKNELEKLIKVKRPQAMTEVDRLAQHGDFSENFPYQMAKGKLRGINSRILYIENSLKQAIIIETKKHPNTIRLGSSVTIEKNGKEQTYQILGSTEVDLKKNTISHNSPLGSELIDHKLGDTIEIKIKDKIIKYKITGIG